MSTAPSSLPMERVVRNIQAGRRWIYLKPWLGVLDPVLWVLLRTLSRGGGGGYASVPQLFGDWNFDFYVGFEPQTVAVSYSCCNKRNKKWRFLIMFQSMPHRCSQRWKFLQLCHRICAYQQSFTPTEQHFLVCLYYAKSRWSTRGS